MTSGTNGQRRGTRRTRDGPGPDLHGSCTPTQNTSPCEERPVNAGLRCTQRADPGLTSLPTGKAREHHPGTGIDWGRNTFWVRVCEVDFVSLVAAHTLEQHSIFSIRTKENSFIVYLIA